MRSLLLRPSPLHSVTTQGQGDGVSKRYERGRGGGVYKNPIYGTIRSRIKVVDLLDELISERNGKGKSEAHGGGEMAISGLNFASKFGYK
ncbi:hypothetical protein E2562_021727 [Oryza meyeriana var. granulata]|uniref:Uncharacterized protein n=1 Tax=Oryza meyeriana var. granulata TaxID=110450 RepID=A0A6G1E0D6_9ORYZ|nr:hypothetical protein E2562_021727 [Oryza meyeriana var. granulata]